MIELVDQGSHGFAGIGASRCFELKVSERALWLANKTALLQLEHFNNVERALGWALTMGLFPPCPLSIPTKSSTKSPAESYYIQLGPEDRFSMDGANRETSFKLRPENLGRAQGRDLPGVVPDAAGG